MRKMENFQWISFLNTQWIVQLWLSIPTPKIFVKILPMPISQTPLTISLVNDLSCQSYDLYEAIY